MLSFLSPWFLAGAAVAAVPIVLHLLKREPEPRLKFAAVKLLKTAPVELTQKRRLRELLLLALRVTALLLLAVAFARPFLASNAVGRSATATLLAIDTSYSMSAPGRIEHARELARKAIDRLAPTEQVGVMTFSDTAEIIARPSADRALALSALDRVESGFGATRYRVALNAAAQALSGQRGTIVVITDLQDSGWDAGDRAAVPDSLSIQIADVGALPANLGVTAVRVAGDRVVATVHNFGSRPRETRVHLRLDGQPSPDTPIAIAPESSVEVPLAAAGKAAAAEVSIDDAEGLRGDNVRYAVVDAASRPSVLVVTGSGDLNREGFYVRHALAAGGAYQVVGSSAARLASAGTDAAPDTGLRSYAAVVLLSTRGLERRGREAIAAYAKSGGGVLLAAGPDIDPDVAADVLGTSAPIRIVKPADSTPSIRTLAPADIRHPIFQPFGDGAAPLGLVKFRSVSRIGGDGCATLARFTTGEPALLECSAGDGRAMVMASDLNNAWNDFPLHPTFVAFVQEAVRYVASARPYETEYLIADAPAGVPRVPGIAAVSSANGRNRRVAVNVDPREADPGRLSPDEFQAAVTPLKDVATTEARIRAADTEDRQHLWQYIVAAMIVALAFEGLVASRSA